MITKVVEASDDNVEFALGYEEGIRLDDTYEVLGADEDGHLDTIGYVKVRNVGSKGRFGPGTTSEAEIVKAERQFEMGDVLLAYPGAGINFGAHFVVQVVYKDFPYKGFEKLHYGPGIYVDYDLARLVEISELYASLDADYFQIGDVYWNDLDLIHIMMGLKKKLYLSNFVLTFGARGGIAYYWLEYQTDINVIGGGGDLFVGFEYMLNPAVSIYINLAGRYFTNPLPETEVGHAPDELGINCSIGIRYGS
jgi:hypothetical protein